MEARSQRAKSPRVSVVTCQYLSRLVYKSRPVYEEVQVPYEYVKEPEYDEVVGKRCWKCGYEVKY